MDCSIYSTSVQTLAAQWLLRTFALPCKYVERMSFVALQSIVYRTSTLLYISAVWGTMNKLERDDTRLIGAVQYCRPQILLIM